MNAHAWIYRRVSGYRGAQRVSTHAQIHQRVRLLYHDRSGGYACADLSTCRQYVGIAAAAGCGWVRLGAAGCGWVRLGAAGCAGADL